MSALEALLGSMESAVANEAVLGRLSLGRFVFSLDERLRRRLLVFDYVDHRDCILRMQISEASEELTLANDLRIRRGDRLIDLHLRNEHLPEMGPDGPSVAWARRISKSLDFSLRELANYLAARPQFEDVAVLRAIMPLRLEQSRHVCFIATRYGFQSAPETSARSLSDSLHRAGENALGLMLVLARNPAAAHLDILLRGRALLYLARRDLDTRYGKKTLEPSR